MLTFAKKLIDRKNNYVLANGEDYFRYIGMMCFSKTKHSKEFLDMFVSTQM